MTRLAPWVPSALASPTTAMIACTSTSDVVYASDRGGDSEILSVPGKGGNERPLTDNSANDYQPAYSPDGESIVFASDRGGGDTDIFRMDANGRHPERVTRNTKDEESPDWGVH